MAYQSRLELVIDSRTGERNLQRVRRELDTTERSGVQSFNSLKVAALGFAGVLGAMGVSNYARQTFEAVRSSQQLQASLKTVTGSAADAGMAWERLIEFAKETPFTLDQSVEAFIRMKSLGLDPTEEALRSFGNTAAAMGKDMMQMVEAVADATTGEFERLKAFGIRASKDGEQISFTFQGVTTTIQNSADAISEYLQSIGDVQFAGAMTDQMATLGGQASNLQDSIYQLYLAIGDAGATDAFSRGLGLASDAVQGLTEALNDGDLDGEIAAVADGLKILAAIAAGRFVASTAAATGGMLAARLEAMRYQAALASMAGVSRTAAASQIALGTAARGAAGALALIGGPVGAATLAAGAMFYFHEELTGVAGQAERTTRRVDDLTNSINTNSEAAVRGQLVNLTGQMFDLERQAISAREEMERITQDSSGGSGALGIAPGRTGEQARAIQELGRIAEEMDAVGKSSDRLRTILDQLEEGGTAPVVDSVRELASGTAELTKAQKEAVREAERFADAFQSLYDRLRPVEASQRRYREEQEAISRAVQDGLVPLGEQARLLRELERDYRNAENAAEVYGFTGKAAMNEVNDAAQDLGFAFESAFENAVIGGEGLRDVLSGILEDISRIVLRQSVTKPLGKAISGLDWGDMFGFATGGYTGPGNKMDPAGIVHAGEFVVQKSVVEKPGVRPMLERLNKGYANGGYVGTPAMGASAAPVSVQIVDQRSGGEQPQVEQTQGPDGRQMVRVMIRDEMKSAFGSGALDRDMANNYGIKRRGY